MIATGNYRASLRAILKLAEDDNTPPDTACEKIAAIADELLKMEKGETQQNQSPVVTDEAEMLSHALTDERMMEICKGRSFYYREVFGMSAAWLRTYRALEAALSSGGVRVNEADLASFRTTVQRICDGEFYRDYDRDTEALGPLRRILSAIDPSPSPAHAETVAPYAAAPAPVEQIKTLLDNCHTVEDIDIAAQHEAVMKLVEAMASLLDTFKAHFAGYEAEPIATDDDGLLLEAAIEANAVMLNDDGTIYAYKQEDLLRLIKCALARDFRPLYGDRT